MIRLIKQYNILFVVGCFILLYNPPFFPINGMHIVGAVSIIYLMINNGITLQILSIEKCRNAYVFMLIWLMYLFFVVTLNSTGYEVCSNPLYYIVDILPFATAIQIYNLKHNLSAKNAVYFMICAASIQALISIIAFFYEGVQLFFIKKLLSYGYNDVVSVVSGWRAYGFAASLTFGMPVIQSVLAVISLYCSSKSKCPFVYLIICVVLLFSAVINARTSFVVTIIGCFILLVTSGLDVKKKISYAVVYITILIAFQLLFLPWLETYSFQTYRWLMEGLDDIDKFIHSDYDNSAYFSYATSANKYEIPEGLFSVIFGTGHYTMGMTSKYGYSSDVGYTNDLWLGGIVYVAFLYVYFFKVMFFLKNNKESTMSFIGLFLLISYLFLNIKGIIFSMMPLTNFLFVIYFVSAAEDGLSPFFRTIVLKRSNKELKKCKGER